MRIRTPWRAAAALFFLNGAFLGMWAARIPAFVDRHGLSEGLLGALLLFLGVGAVLSFPLAGRLADGIGAHRLSRHLALANIAATLALPLAPNALTLGLALAAFGATHGAMDVAMNAFTAEVERAARRPIMGSIHAMWSLGAGFGAATGALAAALGWGAGLHFAVAVPLVGVACLSLTAIPWDSRRSGPKGPAFALPKGPLLLVGLVALASGLGEGTVTDWSAVFLREVLGASEARAALGYMAFAVTMVTMRLLGDRITGRLGPVRSARIAGGVAVTSALVVVLAPAAPVAILGFAGLGLGYAVIIPLAFSRAANDPEVPQGRALASVATLGYGAMLVWPPLVGAVAELTSLRTALALLAASALLIVGLAGDLRPQGSSSASQ